MGLDQNTVPTYGWAEIGKKTYSEQIGGKVARLSMVAGYVCATKKQSLSLSFPEP